MDETILFPSPNWFQSSGVAVTKDGWVIYGGPSKSLCVLRPLPEGSCLVRGNVNYKAIVLNKPQPEKIVSVDVSPQWPEKRSFLAGSADGTVKQFVLEEHADTFKFKSTHSHEIHNHDKEDIVGVGYSNETYAVTVGGFGNIVKWDLNSNVVNTFTTLKNFKPTCMSCSPHSLLQVAIGTKQGVIFVLDINDRGPGKVIYKVRAYDDEILNLTWCPQYEVTLQKSTQESAVEDRKQSKRMDKIKQDTLLDTNKQLPSDNIIKEKATPNSIERVDVEESEVATQLQNKEVEVKDLNRSGVNKELPNDSFVLEKSGVSKNLPDDSFNETEIVQEEDMFDIYKDHEADEFGHKKYQPEIIKVKIKEETKEENDYLAECLQLKQEILKNKNKPETSIQSLVEALDNTHVDKENDDANIPKPSGVESNKTIGHIKQSQKHLLATISKYSGVRVWSQSGKLVSSCAISIPACSKNQRTKVASYAVVYWYKPGSLLIADGKNQLLEANPLVVDSKNRMIWNVVHTFHKRAVFSVTSNAPRVQLQDCDDSNWFILTSAQDRNMVHYSLKDKNIMAVHNTCGGLLYMIKPCPYDARKLALAVGDGAVRVWEAETAGAGRGGAGGLEPGRVTSHWQNVQGRVLFVAWHPTREHLLAFSTRESRVGLIDTNKSDKPAQTFISGLRGGVYSLCWGEDNDLYAAAAGDLVRYNYRRVEDPPTPIKVEVEGQEWDVSNVNWTQRAMLVGSNTGGVAALTSSEPYEPLAAAFPFSKKIHTTEWHPLQTSSSSDESPYKNLIAVCSLDKKNTIVILEYGDKEDGSKKLSTWKVLEGHRDTILQMVWNPHRDGVLLSTSQDHTIRVWEVSSGACVSIFPTRCFTAAWAPRPELASTVISGGSEFCLRLWNTEDFPPEKYHDPKPKFAKRDRKRFKNPEQVSTEEVSVLVDNPETDLQIASSAEAKAKANKRFLFPLITRQINKLQADAVMTMLNLYLENKTVPEKVKTNDPEQNYDMEWLKIFGSINEVNQALDTEMQLHEDTGNTDAWMILSIFRGQIDTMIQYANKHDILCPYLLSITPSVSLKFWKDATQLYLAQIDRLHTKGEEHKLYENRQYGDAVWRSVATQLGLHDIKAAVAHLTQERLFKEAYILCRIRYMDSIAEQALQQWADDSFACGQWIISACCYLALGNLAQAATALGKCNDEESLLAAAEIAKIAGQNLFADHVTEKRALLQSNKVTNETDEVLAQLPSRIQLLMKETDTETGSEGEAGISAAAVDTVTAKVETTE